MTGKKNYKRVLHIWYGRILIALGIICGGMGVKLAANATKGETAAYGAVAGVVFVAYIASLLSYYRRGGTEENSLEANRDARELPK